MVEHVKINLIENGNEYQFTMDNEPVIKIEKDSVKNKEVALAICEALMFTLNTGIEIGKALSEEK